MASDITIDAVRLALGGQQLRAQVAAGNIAGAAVPGFRASRVELDSLQALLKSAIGSEVPAGLGHVSAQGLAQIATDGTGAPVQLDAEVAEMVTASLDYQVLSESLGRYFGLMRLALSGRAGA